MSCKDKIIRFLLMIIFLFTSISLTGCDYLDIDELISVLGMGIDYDEDSSNFLITVETAKIVYSKDEPFQSLISTGKGETITSALIDITRHSPGELYFKHAEIIVLGESTVKTGIGDIIDSLMRSESAQRVVKVVVVKNATAADVFNAKINTKTLISSNINMEIDVQSQRYGTTKDGKIYNLYNNIATGLADILPAIKIEDEVIKLDGTAIINYGQLYGYLSYEESKYCLIAMGEMKDCVLKLPGSESSSPFSFQIISCKSYCKPILKNGQLTMFIKANIEGVIPEIKEYELGKTPINENIFLEEIKKQVITEIEKVIIKVKNEYCADLFYFRPQVENIYRKEWVQWGENWPLYFQTAKIEVSPNIIISDNGISK